MFFFDTVQSCSTAKSFKAVLLLELVRRLEGVVVEGNDAPLKIAIALQEQAQILDRENPRGRAIYIDYSIDPFGLSGQITAYPVSDADEFNKRPYFRISFHRVVRTATISEAVNLVKWPKGGEA